MMGRDIRGALDDYFGFTKLGSTFEREILGGATTFATMAYIVFVNPSILADAGIPFQAAMAATCISAAFGSLFMGLWARHPIALAPGMGLNAYLTYSVVGGMGVDWQTALGAVFLSGAVFLVLTVVGFRRKVLESMPQALFPAIGAGIGLFLALIGLRNVGIIVPNDATLVSLGDLSSPNALLAIGGLLLIASLQARRVPGAVLVGVLAVSVAAAATGLSPWTPLSWSWTEMTAGAFQLDIPAALDIGLLDIVFVFLFVDFFDTLGTVVAVTNKAGLQDEQGRIPRLDRMLTVDAVATMTGAVCGTSTVTSYIESAAGIAAGARTGLAAVTTGLLFLAALPLAPLVGAIPNAATAPALIFVGALMMTTVRDIDWDDSSVGISSFLTLLAIPLTYSIANGLAIGVIAYDALKILKGEGREAGWLVHILAVLFVLRFAYLSAS
ncbi:MAG: NCS2 family permease [Acidobacteria bacterium]|nr:NCS2 family permease [Acidobacteriota bacterium]MDA1233390.1 NCS2 family permease [Acidobacteriota bacterium]